MKNIFRKKSAFTLAEVLITMGIIGVVAALTIPSLMNKYQKEAYVTELHKVYNDVYQALRQVYSDRNTDNPLEAGLTSQEALDTWVKGYFKRVTDCGQDAEPCFAPMSEYRKLNYTGTDLPWGTGGTNVYALPDGATIRPYYVANRTYLLFNIVVDVNGPKGPNIVGRDFFVFNIYKNGRIDDYVDETTNAPLSVDDRNTLFANGCNSSTSNSLLGCFGKIINDGWQMTY